MNSTISQLEGELKFSLEAEAKLKLAMERAARIAEEKGQQLEPAELFASFVEYAQDLLDTALRPSG